MTAPVLHDNPDKHRYELSADGQLVGVAEYNLLDGALLFTHTEVMEGNEGKGYGSVLAKGALDDVRRRRLHAIPVCQFIAGYIRKHPEYLDLVTADSRRAFGI